LFEDPVVIEFKGDLANTDVEQISVEDGTEPLVVEGASTVPGSAVMKTARNGAPAGSVGEESSTAHLRDAVVTLPEGMTVNPASANGLQSCSLGQLGMSAAGKPDGSPVNCPDASKLGTVEAVSPALDHPLAGGVYLAAQNENPFGSLLALYLVIDDPLSGVLVKLAGRVEPNPNTGRLTVSFKNNPQLPVEDLDPDGLSRSFAEWAEQRSYVRPGITGLWQINGRSDLPFDAMMELDLHYIQNWSLGLDMRILMNTPRAVLSGRGAY